MAQQHQSVLICLMGGVEKEVAEKKGNQKLQFQSPRAAQQGDKSKYLVLGGRARKVRLYKQVGDKGTVIGEGKRYLLGRKQKASILRDSVEQ